MKEEIREIYERADALIKLAQEARWPSSPEAALRISNFERISSIQAETLNLLTKAICLLIDQLNKDEKT